MKIGDINSHLTKQSQITELWLAEKCPKTWAKNDLWSHELLFLALWFMEPKKLLTKVFGSTMLVHQTN